jgi:hypothetical protein
LENAPVEGQMIEDRAVGIDRLKRGAENLKRVMSRRGHKFKSQESAD